MKRIYVAGPMGPEFDLRSRRVEQAMGIGLQIVRLGFAVYLPHLWHHADIDGIVPSETWMQCDFRWVESCDAVFRIPGISPGADRECELAREKKIPIFTSLEELLRWKTA